jgi:transcriptional regulator with GAF, ATPase, and Fis domain
MSRNEKIGVLVLLMGVSFTIALAMPPGLMNVWIGRGLLAMVMAAGGMLLSGPFAVSVGILCMPADWYLTFQPAQPEGVRALNSLDFLVWAGYVLLPLYLSNLRGNEIEEQTSPDRDQSTESSTSPREELSAENVEMHPDVTRDLDPTEKVQGLIVNYLQNGHDELDTDNLVYFHVRDGEAKPGYVINDHGTINQNHTIGSDQARGVGWVLRHEDRLRQESDQLDWRNLQYHTKPVDLEQVQLEPVTSENTMIGVLALEWKTPHDIEQEVIEEFVEHIERLMAVDQTVRRTERKQREAELLERLGNLNPLAFDRMETLRQRIKDLVRELIPADHVEIVTDDQADEDNVVKQRRLFYETGCEWIRSRGDILRINNVDNFSYQGRRIGKVAPPDVSSFLGGAITSNDERYGYICLDDGSESFFSSEDETLLKHLIDRAGSLFKIASQFSEYKEDRRRLRNWVQDLASLGTPNDFSAYVNQMLKVFDEHLPVSGMAFYHETSDGYSRLARSEDLSLPTTVESDSPLISRLSGCENQVTVEFPNLGRLKKFNVSASVQSLVICPWFSDAGNLHGFLCLFCSESEQQTVSEFEDLNGVWPIMERELELGREVAKLRDETHREDWTDFRNFDAWKKSLSSMITGDDRDQITLWGLRVPGFESLANSRGRQRTLKWVRSLANRLEEEFEANRMTRAHGTVFYGFEPTDVTTVRRRLDAISDDVFEWSFPLGEWPEPPAIGAVSFQPPFPPEVTAMIEATRKEVLTNQKNDENRKEPASNGT